MVGSEDRKSGTFAVRKATDAEKNGRRAAQSTTSDRPAQNRSDVRPETARAGDEVVQLSPFEVKESTTGYMATNTMSGTRLNTNLEDLASSISVVTKQQMADFALLVASDKQAELEAAAEVLAEELDGRVRLSLVGPMALFDFVPEQ